MKTDYSKLTEADFQRTVNNYVSYLVKTSKIENADKAVNTENWKEFRLGDLFEIKRGLCSDASSLDNGNDIYYVGAKKDDNGVISEVAYDNFLISKGNCIACICDGAGSVGYATYQDKDFIGTVNLRLLYHEKLNTETALFIVPVLDCEREKYSFGRKWGTHLDDTIIKLPATPDGKPDWEYMEQFMKKRYRGGGYKTNVKSRHIPLEIHKWKEFRVGDLFEPMIRGRTLSVEDKEEYQGNIPCINGSAENNGFLCYLDNDINLPLVTAPALSISRVGAGGFTFAQSENFYIADNAYGLHYKNSDTNIYHYLFVSTILNQEIKKYSYGRTISSEKYPDTVIKLPVASDGTPDWKFMENYIKSLPFSDKI